MLMGKGRICGCDSSFEVLRLSICLPAASPSLPVVAPGGLGHERSTCGKSSTYPKEEQMAVIAFFNLSKKVTVLWVEIKDSKMEHQCFAFCQQGKRCQKKRFLPLSDSDPGCCLKALISSSGSADQVRVEELQSNLEEQWLCTMCFLEGL